MRTGSPRPFTFRVGDEAIAALRARLADTRWPDDLDDEDWSWGVPLAEARDLCAYWRDRFDWHAQEARLFSFPHFMIEIDGLDLHFLHARSPHADAMPLIITHGWPGSVFEFLDVIPRLTEPERFGGSAADAFHVVAPSLQGYGFSPPARRAGMSQGQVARRHAALMGALDYERYVAQGGDWGSFVSQLTARADPAHCVGLHLNMVLPLRPKDVADPMALVTEAEQKALARNAAFLKDGFGYYQEQTTKPQTLAYALTDSPAGWCLWAAEKFRDWSDCGGALGGAVSLDAMLGDIALYWFTGTIASGLRFYKEFALARARGDEPLFPLSTPTGIAWYPFEIQICPRAWAERLYPIVHWYEAPRGGHFAAMEQPDLFARDLWAFKKTLKA